jgi:predicted RNase H-like HicB family nuclease
MTRTLYTARAQRDGRWWAISVAGLPGALTQVRRLDQAESMAREVIALVLDVPEDSFDVSVTPDLTKPQRAALDALDQAKANYEKAAAAMTKRQQDVAALLVRKDGLTVRDAAEVLGVSFQRVSQLTAAGTPKKATASAWSSARSGSVNQKTSSK